MEDKILEGFLKPSLSLICPHCEKSHRISSDVKAKITECSKCAKKIQIPDSLEEMDNLIKNLHTMELINRELNDVRKLVIAQEEEIKVLKAGRNYVGLLPSNYRKIESILKIMQDSVEHVQEEINKCYDPERAVEEVSDDSESVSSEAPLEQDEQPEEEN